MNASGDFLEKNCISYPHSNLDRSQQWIAYNKLTKFWDKRLTRFRYAYPNVDVDFRENMQGRVK